VLSGPLAVGAEKLLPDRTVPSAAPGGKILGHRDDVLSGFGRFDRFSRIGTVGFALLVAHALIPSCSGNRSINFFSGGSASERHFLLTFQGVAIKLQPIREHGLDRHGSLIADSSGSAQLADGRVSLETAGS
jgi:hypothetical protein